MHTSEDDVLRQRLQETKHQAKERLLVRGRSEDLLHWRDMPKHLQFNPYIFTGYRPLLSVWGCLNSLFYLHNETINILTHGKEQFPQKIFFFDFCILRFHLTAPILITELLNHTLLHLQKNMILQKPIIYYNNIIIVKVRDESQSVCNKQNVVFINNNKSTKAHQKPKFMYYLQAVLILH